MSGHSKWSTIKRQKEANDQKRGQVFTKIAKAITVAVKEGGGGDPESNFKLRLVIERAKEANMPKDNIKRAIERGAGKGDAGELATLLYEGFGPEKMAVIVEVVTDNKNRTVAEVKHIFERSGGALAQPGAVKFMFKKRGEIVVNKAADVEAQILTIMDLANIEDVEEVDDGVEIRVLTEGLQQVKQKLKQTGFSLKSGDLVWVPINTVKITEKPKIEKVLKFLNELDSHEDIQKVFSNADLVNE